MNACLARCLLRVYPPEWRARYGEEVEALLIESSGTLGVILDLLRSGLRENIRWRLRQRANGFRGVTLSKPTWLTQLGCGLAAIVAFTVVAEATPLWALYRSTNDFVVFPRDARIRYEPGAEKLAGMVADVLPQVLKTINPAPNGLPIESITVYICATERSADAYGNRNGAPAFLFNHKLFVSPELADRNHSILLTLVQALDGPDAKSSVNPKASERILPAWGRSFHEMYFFTDPHVVKPTVAPLYRNDFLRSPIIVKRS